MLPGTPRTFIGSTTFAVRGLTGVASQRFLVELISAVGGVESVTIDFARGTVTVTALEPVDRADIALAVEPAGFALTFGTERGPAGKNPAISPARPRPDRREGQDIGQPANRITHEENDMSHGHGHGNGHGHGHGHGTVTVAAHEHDADDVRRPWTTLAVMLMAQLMVILDISVVNVALPSIGKGLDFASSDYQWTVSAYVLLSGGLLLFGGRLADLFDRRSMFLTGLGLFTAASVVSATASSATAMILSRGAQGAGAALLTPAALSIIVSTYAGRQRATALAIWGTIGSLGIAVGVLFGGMLTSAFGWRAIFIINVPIGVAAALLTLHLVHRGQSVGGVRGMDVPGAATLVAGLLALVYAVEGTRTHGWTSAHTTVAFAAAAVLLGAFAVVERRVPAPLVPPSTWRVRSLVSASTVMAVITGVVVGAIFLNSLFLQSVLGSSAIETGLQFLPLAGSITLGAAVASHLLGKVTPKAMMVVGSFVVAAGSVLLATMDSHPGYVTDILPGFVLIGLGVGPMFVAISVAAMSGIPAEHSGLASGVMMTGHEVGAALGVASLAAIAGDLTTRSGLVDGFPTVFTVVAIAMVALAGFVALALPRQHSHDVHHARMH